MENLPSTAEDGEPLNKACHIHSNQRRENLLMARLNAQTEHDDDHHEHEHDDSHKKNSRKVSFLIMITFLFFLVELLVGLLNRSVALLADSYHMLSDVMALVIALVCLKISQRKSKKNGFGWVRAEVFGALVNGVFLLAICFTILLEAVGRLIRPRAMLHPFHVFIVGLIGLFINFIGISLFHGAHGHSHGGGEHGHSHNHSTKTKQEVVATIKDEECTHEEADKALIKTRPARSMSHLSSTCSHNHLALRFMLDDDALAEEFGSDESLEDATEQAAMRKKKQENLNMHGVFLHIISDAIGSVFVIVTAGLAYFLADRLGPILNYLDPILSLCLVTLICISASKLVKETADIILARSPQFVNIEALKKDMSKVRGVAGVKDINVWTLVASRHLATAHVEFCNAAAFDEAAPKIRKLFHGVGIHSLTLQPYFSQNGCGSPNGNTAAAHIASSEPSGNEITAESN